jgi:integrase
MILFEESCRSEVTKYVYKKNLDEFLNWAHKDYDSFLLMPQKQLEELLQDYLIFKKRRVSPNSLQVPFSAIYKFLDVNGKEYNKKKVKMLFPQRVKAGGERAITDKELRDLIRVAPSKKSLALIHVLASTGCRPEAIAQLQLKHIEDMPDGFKALTVYPGSLNEMVTFLHPEASVAVESYLKSRSEQGERLTPESHLLVATTFKTRIKNKPLSTSTITRIVFGVLKRAEVKRVRSTSRRYDLATCTGIRKRFNTKLKKNPTISYAIAENLMDHKYRLEGHYLKPTKEEIFEEYKKAVSDLMIDDSKIKELKIQQLEEEKSELKIKEKQIDELQKNFEDFKKESFSEIEKLKYANQVKSAYLKAGEFPKIEHRGDKTMRHYKSLAELESEK